MTCDFIALVLQAVGGAIADTASTKKSSDRGTHTMVGGLGFQVISLLLFIGLALEFALNVRRDKQAGRFQGEAMENAGFNEKSEGAFKMFLFGRYFPCHLNIMATLADGDTQHCHWPQYLSSHVHASESRSLQRASEANWQTRRSRS